MRRGLRGATRCPPLERPGNGYGRPVRPGPVPGMRHGERMDLDELVALLLEHDRSVSLEQQERA